MTFYFFKEVSMKKICSLLAALLLVFFMVSCGGDEDEPSDQGNTGNGENEAGDTGTAGGDSGDSSYSGDSGYEGGDSGYEGNDTHEGGVYITCTPGETVECYEGPSGTAGVGICKAGYKECVEDGTDWSECRDQVLPKAEICGDNIDQDCDGQDATPENVVDIDGDGYNYCNGDCCETGWDCPAKDPARVNPGSFEVPGNGIDDNCDGHIDEQASYCDSGLAPDSTNPMEMAMAMDLCPAQDENMFGIVSAKLLFPDGTEGNIPADQHKILPVFGNNNLPNAGMSLLALSSGSINGKSEDKDNGTQSGAPADWFQANGGQSFPNSPACGGGMIAGQNDPGKPPVNDPIMLELEIRAPYNAESFSVDVNYFSREFPQYVCQYNDFFVMLLDSQFTTDNPSYANPADKNIAMDENKNPMGINLAKSGLFKVCKPRAAYPSCAGDEGLKGTGFDGATVADSCGATGWLEVRGNVVPREVFKLRMAIWDTNDHVLESMVLLDNFTWYESPQKPGIGSK